MEHLVVEEIMQIFGGSDCVCRPPDLVPGDMTRLHPPGITNSVDCEKTCCRELRSIGWQWFASEHNSNTRPTNFGRC
jgi:hypothetical protein